MKNPILKSIIRRPIKFILLILILSLVSGAFIMNFNIVSKEIESAKEAYNSIGYIQIDLSDENIDGNVYDIREMLKDEPMIAYEDCNIYTLGISDNLLNADYNTAAKFLNDESTDTYFSIRDLLVIVKPENIRTIISGKGKYDGVVLESRVQALLGGYPDWIYMPDGKMFNDGFFKIVAPKYESFTTNLIPYINDKTIDELYTLETGVNYLFRCEAMDFGDLYFLLKPLYDGGPLYEKINNIDDFNLDDSKWQKMKEDMELLDINTRSFRMIATKNMETLTSTQESVGGDTLFDGRWINYDDYKSNNKVCVIGKDLFQVRNLGLGDKIPIQYMESEFHDYLITKKDRKEWKNYHKSDVIEYEIVGVYDSYSSGKNIYIPTSTVPEEFLEFFSVDGEPYLWVQLYNFVLENPAEQSQFIEKYGDRIKEAGHELQFIENNAETFWISTDKVLNNLKTNIALYGILLLFSMLFIIYMYMEIYKNNYAIERILGVTHKSAARHLLIPLYGFSTLGVGFSSYIGYQTAIRNSQKILEEILGELPDTLDFSISIKFVFIIFLIIIVVLMIQSLFMVFKLRKQSLLDFFSKGKGKGKGKDKDGKKDKVQNLDIADNEFHTDNLADVLSFDDSSFDISKGKRVFKGYGRKYISRSIGTTILMVVITGLLIGTLIWLNNVIQSNQAFIEKTIYETTIFGEIDYIDEVKISDKGNITEEILNKTLETNLVEGYIGAIRNEYNEINIDRNGTEETIKKEYILNLAYYEKNPNMTVLASNKELNSDCGIKVSGIEDESIIDKFNSYRSNKDEIPILASTVAMDTYNLEIGDKIALRDSGPNYPFVYGTIIGTFEGYVSPVYRTSQVEWIPICEHETFIFPIDALRLIERSGISYEKIDLLFNKDKNIELYYNREEILNEIGKTKYGDSTGYKLVLHDDILTETIEPLEKNLELLGIIYPIVLVLSLIIAVVLPYLLILRRSEELAIMRILGVKEVEIKKYVFAESLLLIIVGEVIAMVAIGIINSKSGVYPIWKYVFVIFGYLLASIVGILSSLKKVLHKKPLDMLQVKE